MHTHSDLPEELPYMSPLTNRIEASKLKGFTDDFEIASATSMIDGSTQTAYAPAAVTIVNYYRFEGMSDPGDNNILYEIETRDGKKGTLATPYGPDCPAHIAEYVVAIKQIAKQRAGAVDTILS